MKNCVLLLTVVALTGAHADTSLGSCPDVEPMAAFEINKFLGYWYSIQKNSAVPCLSYNITEDEDVVGKYIITEIEQHSTLLSTLHHEHHTSGVLTVPKKTIPAKLSLDLPLDLGSHSYIVFMTDYTNYAAVFTCKKLPLAHKWSMEILSRNPTLDMAFVDKVRTRISSYNIDPFSLDIVRQKDCAKPGTQGGLISAGSNLVTNVQEKIQNLTSLPS